MFSDKSNLNHVAMNKVVWLPIQVYLIGKVEVKDTKNISRSQNKDINSIL